MGALLALYAAMWLVNLGQFVALGLGLSEGDVPTAVWVGAGFGVVFFFALPFMAWFLWQEARR